MEISHTTIPISNYLTQKLPASPLFDSAYHIAWGEEFGSDQIFQGDEEVIALTADKEPVAIAIYSRSEKNHPYLMMIYTKETHRRHGYAGSLVEAIAKECSCTSNDIVGEATTLEGKLFSTSKLPQLLPSIDI